MLSLPFFLGLEWPEFDGYGTGRMQRAILGELEYPPEPSHAAAFISRLVGAAFSCGVLEPHRRAASAHGTR